MQTPAVKIHSSVGLEPHHLVKSLRLDSLRSSRCSIRLSRQRPAARLKNQLHLLISIKYAQVSARGRGQETEKPSHTRSAPAEMWRLVLNSANLPETPEFWWLNSIFENLDDTSELKKRFILNKCWTLEEIQRFCSCVDTAEPQGQLPQVVQR